MSNTKTIMSQASNQYVAPTYIEDVFSTYLYTGNGSTQTITNGIDLAGEGGLVWLKQRDDSRAHYLFDTARGLPYLQTHDDFAQQGLPYDYFTSYNSDGFTIPNKTTINENTKKYASWTFRKAPRFFDVVTWSGDATGTRSIPHSLNSDVGFIVIKSTNLAEPWWVVHRSRGAFESAYGVLNSSDGFIDASSGVLNVTSESFDVSNYYNLSGKSYVAYLFAHDPLGPSGDGSDGLIACGSYAGANHRNQELVDLGWEPQWVLVKNATDNSALGDTDWVIVDTMRGMSHTSEAHLFANLSDAELSTSDCVAPDPQGFRFIGADRDLNRNGDDYIYIAIRRGPMRVPESGAEVFAIDTKQSTEPAFVSNFPVDMAIRKLTTGSTSLVSSRLNSGNYLRADNTDAESVSPSYVFDYQNGYSSLTGASSSDYSWMFRRAPNFFDVVAYTGDGTAGHTVPHNLGVKPELMIVKERSSSGNWSVYVESLTATDYLALNETRETYTTPATWNDTEPTATEFTLGSFGNVNANGTTFIAYLFASLDGVSKVGSYTGNGTSQTIDCGFTSGARFILVKRTDSTGDWYVWDTERGIVSGNDPYLELNTTDAEVTNTDWVDPDNSGFAVNGTTINASGGNYIFLAIA